MDSPLLDYDDAAAYLSVGVHWLRRAVVERRITFVRIGRSTRFRVSDLDQFIESQMVTPGGEQ